jgi:hypothetical protein
MFLSVGLFSQKCGIENYIHNIRELDKNFDSKVSLKINAIKSNLLMRIKS